jgi:hypothetical protein
LNYLQHNNNTRIMKEEILNIIDKLREKDILYNLEDAPEPF